MVSQRTVLIVTCIAAAFEIVLLGLLAVYPHVAPSWMFAGMEDSFQQMANSMTATSNYIMQVLW